MTVKPRKKIPTITTIEIECAIADKFGTRENIIVPNISWGLSGMHECDVFIVKRNGYAIEVEIKRSKSDLLADFKKTHGHKDNRIKELYYAIPEKQYNAWKDLIPKHAGILTYWKFEEEIWNAKLKRWSGEFRWITRVQYKKTAVDNRIARKLTYKEQLKVAKLGTMRIWNLKKKIIKMQNERREV
jgi:hypothetical protein